MKAFLQSIFGEFHGNVIFVLLDATQWTIYLSLTAFIGGGLLGLLITSFRVSRIKPLQWLAISYI
jgi:polar amino acid transport system permease protein